MSTAYLRIYEDIGSTMVRAAKMVRVSEEASGLLKTLASPKRLLILCQLAEGERSVGALAEFIRANEATVSQHLSILRREGLVKTRRENQTIFYALKSEPARAVLETLYSIYCNPSNRSSSRA
jgi:DNA-binding transcriptional ArsR family regulator